MTRPNPRRPPTQWWDDCVRSVASKSRGSRSNARHPRAICGAAWWGLPEARREAIVRAMERSHNPRVRAGASALALAEYDRQRKRGKRAMCASSARPRKPNPRELVSLVYLEQKPGDREAYEYEHEFEGERPTLEMKGNRMQVRGGSYRSKRGWLYG